MKNNTTQTQAASNMEPDSETNSPQQTRRNNSKLKVLVRSHAMREETSPPRDPPNSLLVSPSINVISSPTTSPRQSPPLPQSRPVVVLSSSLNANNLSSSCTSSASTLVPSPTNKLSPNSSPPHVTEVVDNSKSEEQDAQGSNRRNSPKGNQDKLHCGLNIQEEKSQNKENFVEGTSQEVCRHEKYICSCSNQKCLKCSDVHERNYNNNISNININNNLISSSNTLTVSRAAKMGKLRQQSSSSQGSFDGISSTSSRLSRDNSSEQYTDSTGIDLDQFIAETLNRNAKDRALMLRIEQELVNLAKDRLKTHYKFPPMSSYQRMLVHRCAAYFGMDHNIESSGKCVVVNKTKNTRIPEIEFKNHIRDDIVFTEEPRRSILKRDSSSGEDYSFKSPDRQLSLESRRSKSFEEREEEYEKVRRRIFNKEMHDFSSAEEFYWADVPWSSSDSDYSSRCRLLPPTKSSGRLLKVQSVETESETARPCVAKSYSFGGYAGMSVITRGDSVLSTHSAGPRLLTKQDSGTSTISWRLSPSSSGYKSQSQLSESVTPSPTSTPYPSGESRQDSFNSGMSNVNASEQSICPSEVQGQVVWAVTDIQHVPKGSIIINPRMMKIALENFSIHSMLSKRARLTTLICRDMHLLICQHQKMKDLVYSTGEPIKNKDGSIYHYDPNNPPPGLSTVPTKPPVSPQKSPPQKLLKETATSPKKRSRASPLKKSNTTNSSTSPSLPFTPPPQSGNIIFRVPNETGPVLSLQQYPPFGSGYTSVGPSDAPASVYQQPCIVYGSYATPVQQNYEGRIESQVQEPSVGYYVQMNLPDIPANSSTPVAYQQQSVWPQHSIACYQNSPSSNVPPGQRLAIPLPSGQTGPCLSTSFPQNYVPQPIPNLPQAPHSAELVPLFPQQHVHMVYSQQSGQQNPVVYSNQPVVYAQNPLYHNVMVPMQGIPSNVPYPQCTSVSNNCTSTVTNTMYNNPTPDHGIGGSVGQITHNISQLSLFPGQGNSASNVSHLVNFDARSQKTGTPKGNKFSIPKNFSTCSSQSGSTGTNSPATTVIAGGYNGGPIHMYQTSQTPPTQNLPFSYPSGFVQAGLHKQATGAYAAPPSRSSRSPTPASDISHTDKHRFSLPPMLYQGMPFVLQDTRVVPSRGQNSSYRQPLRQQTLNQNSENYNRLQKNRKFRGNKSVPPSGK